MAIRQEIQEVIDKWTAAKSDGKITRQEAHEIAREVFDVVKILLDADDSPDARRQLSGELSIGLVAIVESVLKGRPVIRQVASMFVGSMATTIVDRAAEFTGVASEFLESNVLPVTTEWERTLHDFNVAVTA
jgi:hypothetical protein